VLYDVCSDNFGSVETLSNGNGIRRYTMLLCGGSVDDLVLGGRREMTCRQRRHAEVENAKMILFDIDDNSYSSLPPCTS
jgi:hypothetical protein